MARKINLEDLLAALRAQHHGSTQRDRASALRQQYLADKAPSRPVGDKSQSMDAALQARELDVQKGQMEASNRNRVDKAKTFDLSSDVPMRLPKFDKVNKTNNSRAGLKYREVAQDGGVVHEYENGDRVFIPKSAAQSRYRYATPKGRGTGRRYF
jgi:hypothetical protein